MERCLEILQPADDIVDGIISLYNKFPKKNNTNSYKNMALMQAMLL